MLPHLYLRGLDSHDIRGKRSDGEKLLYNYSTITIWRQILGEYSYLQRVSILAGPEDRAAQHGVVLLGLLHSSQELVYPPYEATCNIPTNGFRTISTPTISVCKHTHKSTVCQMAYSKCDDNLTKTLNPE